MWASMLDFIIEYVGLCVHIRAHWCDSAVLSINSWTTEETILTFHLCIPPYICTFPWTSSPSLKFGMCISGQFSFGKICISFVWKLDAFMPKENCAVIHTLHVTCTNPCIILFILLRVAVPTDMKLIYSLSDIVLLVATFLEKRIYGSKFWICWAYARQIIYSQGASLLFCGLLSLFPFFDSLKE